MEVRLHCEAPFRLAGGMALPKRLAYRGLASMRFPAETGPLRALAGGRSDHARGKGELRSEVLGTYGARRIWRDVLGEAGFSCVACTKTPVRLMRAQALRASGHAGAPLPKDDGERSASTISPNVLDIRQFTADQPNRKWIADFTYV